MSTDTPRSPFGDEGNSAYSGLQACMDLRRMFRERQWLALGLGILLWAIGWTLMVIMVPAAIIFGIWAFITTTILKFRRVLADILRPKNVVSVGNPRPDSDMAAMFCEYEASLIRGKESHRERFALISRMAHIEMELEEYRVFSAAISRLRREEALPQRREAILHSRLRKRARAEGKIDGDGESKKE